jgi:predicted transposase YdaD
LKIPAGAHIIKKEAAMGANTRYKDSVFSFLFNDPGTLRELYGALADIKLPPDTPVTINTLEGVLYKTRLNDVSFEIDNKLVIILEHQSTINPNLPVRLLMYIGRIYEKITAGRNIYGSKRLSLPRPEFIVLYNGIAPYPEEATLKLSDLYERIDFAGFGQDKPVELELTVKVYNINRGYNEAVLKRSKTLGAYSFFIAAVREYEQRGKSREEAMELAVKECIEKGILREFLETHGSEVINMLMNEWKLEDALVVEREEGREEGWGEAVKKLLAYGMDPEQVSQALQLSPDMVKQYLN